MTNKCLVLARIKFYFLKKNTLILPKCSLKLISSKCPSLGACVSTDGLAFNCTSLLADLFLYSYETYFLQRLLVTNEKKLSRAFTFRYMNDVLHDIIMSFC